MIYVSKWQKSCTKYAPKLASRGLMPLQEVWVWFWICNTLAPLINRHSAEDTYGYLLTLSYEWCGSHCKAIFVKYLKLSEKIYIIWYIWKKPSYILSRYKICHMYSVISVHKLTSMRPRKGELPWWSKQDMILEDLLSYYERHYLNEFCRYTEHIFSVHFLTVRQNIAFFAAQKHYTFTFPAYSFVSILTVFCDDKFLMWYILPVFQ